MDKNSLIESIMRARDLIMDQPVQSDWVVLHPMALEQMDRAYIREIRNCITPGQYSATCSRWKSLIKLVKSGRRLKSGKIGKLGNSDVYLSRLLPTDTDIAGGSYEAKLTNPDPWSYPGGGVRINDNQQFKGIQSWQ